MNSQSGDDDRELVTILCLSASDRIEWIEFLEYVMTSIVVVVLMMVIGPCICVLQQRIRRIEAMYEARLALYERIMTCLHRELSMVIMRQERQHDETRTAEQERHHLRDRVANLEQERYHLRDRVANLEQERHHHRDRVANLEQEMPLLRNRLADTETTNREQDIQICRVYSRIRAPQSAHPRADYTEN